MGVKQRSVYRWYDNKHNHHAIVVIKKRSGPHYAELRCSECDTWIKWLSQREYMILQGDNYGQVSKI